LTLLEVDGAFEQITGVAGPGSNAERMRVLGELFERATRDEQEFLVRLILGDLRQGALEGIMVEAVARATTIPSREVRRAACAQGESLYFPQEMGVFLVQPTREWPGYIVGAHWSRVHATA
jgi:DNA ligase-1